MGEVLKAFGEALLASTDITIEQMQALHCACKHAAAACRRAIELREEELRANKRHES